MPQNARHEAGYRFRSGRRFASAATCDRRATATIECVLVFPLLLTLTIGTIDLCSAFFLKESAVLAAYEGARQGINRGGTNDDVRRRVIEFMNERNISFNPSDISISSPGFNNASPLESVTVNVVIRAGQNLILPSEILGDLAINGTVTMVKEYENVRDN